MPTDTYQIAAGGDDGVELTSGGGARGGGGIVDNASFVFMDNDGDLGVWLFEGIELPTTGLVIDQARFGLKVGGFSGDDANHRFTIARTLTPDIITSTAPSTYTPTTAVADWVATGLNPSETDTYSYLTVTSVVEEWAALPGRTGDPTDLIAMLEALGSEVLNGRTFERNGIGAADAAVLEITWHIADVDPGNPSYQMSSVG